MPRFIAPGSRLNEIAGSLLQYPGWQVLVYNPHTNKINDLAVGRPNDAPIDISAFVQSIEFNENIGFENGDDPSTPQITILLNRNPNTGINIRRGLIEDGVLVQIKEGDVRIDKDEWVVTFTGTFRGRPGDNQGTRHNQTEGLQATAFGREERFLNLMITTETYPADTDLGDMLVSVAQKYLALTQDEILIGSQGFVTKHITNQLVEIPALEALWSLLFPKGKKPKFDSLGRLVAVDVNLDKPAVRLYSGGDVLVKECIASPNDVEVNNSVILRGLDHNKTRIIQEEQLITEFEVTVGFFDREFDEGIYYSSDHSQRAQDTHLVVKHKIEWSDPSWTEIDEFHGDCVIDTHHLANARAIIFVVWLVLELAAAALDAINVILASLGPEMVEVVAVISAIQNIIKIASLIALAGLLWAMQFVGRGKYQIWGRPFEYVYQELVSQHEISGLEPEEVRQIEFRNDFISTMDDLDERCTELLHREMLKNQLYRIVLVNDCVLEGDDVIEFTNGDRYYIVSVHRSMARDESAEIEMVCWKIFDRETAVIEALELLTIEEEE